MTEERYRVGQTLMLAQHIAGKVAAYHNCAEHPDKYPGWMARYKAAALAATDYLPSGSGIDSGPTLDIQASSAERLVIDLSYHHMDAHGGYDGWTDHRITVRPSLIHTVKLTISGQDRNGTKDYLYEIYQYALTQPLVEVYIIPEDRSTFIQPEHLEDMLSPAQTVGERGAW